MGGIDGIELDGKGGLLVTDVIGQRLLQVAPAGPCGCWRSSRPAAPTSATCRRTRTAVVPFLFENRVAAYDLTAALR